MCGNCLLLWFGTCNSLLIFCLVSRRLLLFSYVDEWRAAYCWSCWLNCFKTKNDKFVSLFSCRVFLLPVSMSDSDEYGKTDLLCLNLSFLIWILNRGKIHRVETYTQKRNHQTIVDSGRSYCNCNSKSQQLKARGNEAADQLKMRLSSVNPSATITQDIVSDLSILTSLFSGLSTALTHWIISSKLSHAMSSVNHRTGN